MKFARALLPDGQVRDGVVAGTDFLSLEALGRDNSIAELLADWDQNVRSLGSALADHGAADDPARTALQDCKLLAPTTPRQIFQVALNYHAHATEMGLPVPDRPFVFQGLPSALCGPDDAVTLPVDSDQLDWELELAFVVKKDAYRVPVADAADFIAGYLMVNDLTGRDLLHRCGHGRLDYVAAKNAPNFLPAGPFLVSAEAVDLENLIVQLTVNGEVMQDGHTSDMIFDPGELLSAISASAKLLAGDLVLTGTPAGTGHAVQRYLRDGDRTESHITGLGRQHTSYVDGRGGESW